jgi:hypothetical protein
MTEQTTLICGEAGGPMIDGSVEEVCADCGRAIVVAPTGQAIRDETTTLLCIPCGMKAIKNDPDPTLMHATEAQMAEIREHFRRR